MMSESEQLRMVLNEIDCRVIYQYINTENPSQELINKVEYQLLKFIQNNRIYSNQITIGIGNSASKLDMFYPVYLDYLVGIKELHLEDPRDRYFWLIRPYHYFLKTGYNTNSIIKCIINAEIYLTPLR